jgi:hypothetical protein
MTKKSEAARLTLAQDIESYLCGEVPSPLDMERAARIDNWDTFIGRRGRHGEEFSLHLSGVVSKHPTLEDGQSISTSAVMWFDRKARLARTQNRLYALGDHARGHRREEGSDT